VLYLYFRKKEAFMKYSIPLLLILFSNLVQADVQVDGYYKTDGTYVQPHYRSEPNNNSSDNWSTKGNVNPYTGQKGTR
jgi:hypothetical protein